MNRVTALRLLVPALVLGLLVGAPAVMRAQTPAPPRPPSDATLNGEVVDTNPLTVRVDGQDRLLQTAPTLVVNRGGKEVKLGELKKGDRVTFTTNPDNSVQRIDVTKAASDNTKWLLLLLVVVLVVVAAAVIWYLSQRRRARHV